MGRTDGVDEYLDGVPQPSRDALEKLRRTIKSAAPEATETISYGMPTIRYGGRFLVSYAAFSRHCSLFPATARVRETCGEALEPYLSGKGTLRFTVEEPIPAALVKKIVKVRLEENAERRRRSEGA